MQAQWLKLRRRRHQCELRVEASLLQASLEAGTAHAFYYEESLAGGDYIIVNS